MGPKAAAAGRGSSSIMAALSGRPPSTGIPNGCPPMRLDYALVRPFVNFSLAGMGEVFAQAIVAYQNFAKGQKKKKKKGDAPKKGGASGGGGSKSEAAEAADIFAMLNGETPSGGGGSGATAAQCDKTHIEQPLLADMFLTASKEMAPETHDRMMRFARHIQAIVKKIAGITRANPIGDPKRVAVALMLILNNPPKWAEGPLQPFQVAIAFSLALFLPSSTAESDGDTRVNEYMNEGEDKFVVFKDTLLARNDGSYWILQNEVKGKDGVELGKLRDMVIDFHKKHPVPKASAAATDEPDEDAEDDAETAKAESKEEDAPPPVEAPAAADEDDFYGGGATATDAAFKKKKKPKADDDDQEAEAVAAAADDEEEVEEPTEVATPKKKKKKKEEAKKKKRRIRKVASDDDDDEGDADYAKMKAEAKAELEKLPDDGLTDPNTDEDAPTAAAAETKRDAPVAADEDADSTALVATMRAESASAVAKLAEIAKQSPLEKVPEDCRVEAPAATAAAVAAPEPVVDPFDF